MQYLFSFMFSLLSRRRERRKNGYIPYKTNGGIVRESEFPPMSDMTSKTFSSHFRYNFLRRKKSVRWPGIEPGSNAWKASMLTITPPTRTSWPCLLQVCIEDMFRYFKLYFAYIFAYILSTFRFEEYGSNPFLI